MGTSATEEPGLPPGSGGVAESFGLPARQGICGVPAFRVLEGDPEPFLNATLSGIKEGFLPILGMPGIFYLAKHAFDQRQTSSLEKSVLSAEWQVL